MSMRASRWMIAVTVGMIVPLVGCAGSRSFVRLEEIGVKRALNGLRFEASEHRTLCWGVGDNSAAFRPALYAPYPGPYTVWCLAIYRDEQKQGAVFVEKGRGLGGYYVYLVPDVSLDESDGFVKGGGKAQLLWVDADTTTTRDLPPNAIPRHEGYITFTLDKRTPVPDVAMLDILGGLRPVALRLLTKIGMCKDILGAGGCPADNAPSTAAKAP